MGFIPFSNGQKFLVMARGLSIPLYMFTVVNSEVQSVLVMSTLPLSVKENASHSSKEHNFWGHNDVIET